MTNPVPVDLPAGVVQMGTEYQTRQYWADSNLIRFVGKAVTPLGGWEAIVGGPDMVMGATRSFHSWSDNFGRKWVAIGTSQGLYVMDAYGATHNITPIGFVPGGESPGSAFGYGTYHFGVEDYDEPVGDESTSTSSQVINLIFNYWHLDNWGENLVACQDADGKLYEWPPTNLFAKATPIVAAGTPSGNALPISPRGMVVTDERYMMAFGAKRDVAGPPQPRRVQWCNQEDNTTWKPDPLNSCGDIDLASPGAFVRAVRFHEETLVFTTNDVHRMRFVGYPDVYVPERIASNCGLVAPTAIAKSADTLMWLSPRGLYTYDGQSVQPMQAPVAQNFAGDIMQHILATRTAALGHNELFNEFMVFYPSMGVSEPDLYAQWSYVGDWWAVGRMQRTAWESAFALDHPVSARYVPSGETMVTFTGMSATFNIAPGAMVNFAKSGVLTGQAIVESVTFTDAPANTAGHIILSDVQGAFSVGAGHQLVEGVESADIVGRAAVPGQTVLYKHEVGYGYIDLVGELAGQPMVRSGPVQLSQGEQFVTADRMMYDVEGKTDGLEFQLEFSSAPNGHVLKALPFIRCNDARGYSDFRGVGRSVIITFRGYVGNTEFWRMGQMRFHTQPGEGR